jgi:hypothetical protein
MPAHGVYFVDYKGFFLGFVFDDLDFADYFKGDFSYYFDGDFVYDFKDFSLGFGDGCRDGLGVVKGSSGDGGGSLDGCLYGGGCFDGSGRFQGSRGLRRDRGFNRCCGLCLRGRTPRYQLCDRLFLFPLRLRGTRAY